MSAARTTARTDRGSSASQAQAAQRLRRLSWLLDDAIPLPGGYRIGWDGVVGLIPGIGDAIGASLSSYIVVEAARMGVSKAVLARMVINILLELLVGAVPVLGDLFDFAFKANARNVALMRRALTAPAPTRRRSGVLLFAVAAAIIAAAAAVLIVVAAIVSAAWGALFG